MDPFIIEYFKEMRNELNTRIKSHTQFINWKIISTGGLFSVLIKLLSDVESNGSGTLLLIVGGFAFLPVISMIFDLMIAKNINNIHKIGCFIKYQIEGKYNEHEMLWEKYCGQSEKHPENRCYNLKDVKIISLFTKLVIIVSFIGSIFCVLKLVGMNIFEGNDLLNNSNPTPYTEALITIIVILIYIFYIFKFKKHNKKIICLITSRYNEEGYLE